jgi:hypothetical protein
MKHWVRSNRWFLFFDATLLVTAGIVFSAYAGFGHKLLAAIYQQRGSGILSRFLMSGRATTPLQNYLDAFDRLVWVTGVWLVAVVLALSLLLQFKLLAKTIWVVVSFLFATFFLFSVFEIFPSFIAPLNLDAIQYFAYRSRFLYDDQLVYRKKPNQLFKAHNFRGDRYSPSYGIEVAPLPYEATVTDENGFLNEIPHAQSEIVVLGDSFIEFRVNKQDSFVRRLERISGLTVTDYGVGSHGPFQYLEVFKRYALRQKPKFAIFSLFNGNDLDDVDSYVQWRQGGDYYHNPIAEPLYSRYLIAMTQTGRFVRSALEQFGGRLGDGRIQGRDLIHPEIAEVRFGTNTTKMELMWYTKPPRSTADLLASGEFQGLKRILLEFAALCKRHGVVPILMNIPTKTHLYARYSTEQSGRSWKQIRDEQIRAKDNIDEAITALAAAIRIEYINLSPVFFKAAEQGVLLYYPFDTHWNSEGREIAAQHVAATLKAKFGTAIRQPQARRET